MTAETDTNHLTRRETLALAAATTIGGAVPAAFAQTSAEGRRGRVGQGTEDYVGSSGRPDIFFIQTQYLPWQAHKVRGSGCERRLLSTNSRTGAESFIMKLSPGFKSAAPYYLGVDFEFFVVDGNIEINGIKYHRHCYGMHPTNYVHKSFSSTSGATLIVITVGGPDQLHRGTTPKAEFRKDRLAEIVDSRQRKWMYGPDPTRFPPGPPPKPPVQPGEPKSPAFPTVFEKPLWTDPDNKGHSFLWAGIPHKSTIKAVTSHNVDSEQFHLLGDYTEGAEGRLMPGAYAMFKANVFHGPYDTEFGYLTFIKYYGLLTNIASPPGAEISSHTFDPPHRPKLPPELAKYGKPVEMPKWWNQTLKI